jgi:hypothetical protein
MICNKRSEVLGEITAIIRLVIILGKKFKKAIIVRPITALERVHKDEAPTRLQNPGAFAKDCPTNAWRQFVEQENANQRILALVRYRQAFCLCRGEVHSGPAPEILRGMSEVRLRHVNAKDRKPRPKLFDCVDKSPCTAADIDNL